MFDPFRRRFLFLAAAFVGKQTVPVFAQSTGAEEKSSEKNSKPLCVKHTSINVDRESLGTWDLRTSLYERGDDKSWPTRDVFVWKSRAVARSHFDQVSFGFRRNEGRIFSVHIEVRTEHAFKREQPISTLKTGLFRIDALGQPLTSKKVRSSSTRKPASGTEAVQLKNITNVVIDAAQGQLLWRALTTGGDIKAHVLIPAKDGAGTVGAYAVPIETAPLPQAPARFEELKRDLIATAEADECSVASTRGCYITTVCCSAAGLSDNCYELRTLRAFRDKWLTYQRGGREDILEYRRTAPDLAKRLRLSPECANTSRRLYTQYILPSVFMIKLGMNSQAWKHYRRMVRFLERTI